MIQFLHILKDWTLLIVIKSLEKQEKLEAQNA